jgi:hypothetical protein
MVAKKFLKKFRKFRKKKLKSRARARAQVSAGERASPNWAKISQNNPSYTPRK